ncbi:MAG: hypothetical protein Q9173_003521 [Seirophora scorigena]
MTSPSRCPPCQNVTRARPSKAATHRTQANLTPPKQTPRPKMPRGNASQSKVHYQGKDEDFVIMVDDVASVQAWKDDRSIPLAQVVSGFKIFVTHKYVLFSPPPLPTIHAFLMKSELSADKKTRRNRHGAQNAYDTASKQTLDNEFGTHNEDECMMKILEGGTLQETEVGCCFFYLPPFEPDRGSDKKDGETDVLWAALDLGAPGTEE